MRVAGVQMDVKLGDVPGNLQRMLDRLQEARSHGAELVVFPECALTGYCFNSRTEAAAYAQPIPGPATDTFHAACRELECWVAFGLLEAAEDQLFNAAALVGPAGVAGSYRKVHLPFLGVDRYTDYGDRPFAVQNVSGINLGLNICYDAGFPEPARCLTLLGADLIVLPTNWPPGAEAAADYAINTRAMENAVYFMAVNRVGVERGFQFIGHSRICDPLGRTLTHAAHKGEEIVYADIDPELSRKKHQIRVAGLNEIDRLADRRPEMYGPIVAPHQLLRPRDRHRAAAR
uniref:Carbon-nitrogen hydrolase family protein n=1 Tax=Schlesneria paludicola TaxID=360056 RepID=A0A7C4LMA1_9PLAN